MKRNRYLATFVCLAAFASLCPLVRAQVSVSIAPVPRLQFLDQNGNPLAGGCVYTYAAGTTTPQATYTDYTGSTQNLNPVILDSAGRASIWLTAAAYKFAVWSIGGNSCTSGALQYTVDGIAVVNLAAVPSITSAAADPATSGFIRMANGDIVNWRNIANSANIGFAQAGVAAATNGNIADVLQYGTAVTGGLQAQVFMDFSGAPAQSGDLRGGNNVCLAAARNAAGNGDVCAILVNTSNQVQLGGSAGVALNGAFASAVNAPAVESIQMADQQAGSDCGAKINAADTALGSTPGEIWVNRNCGTSWTTAVSLSQNHVLRFIQGGEYATAGCPAVTLNQGSTLVGEPLSSWDNQSSCNGTVGACLASTSATNCSTFVLVNGADAQVRDMLLDGNRSGNPTEGVGIKVNLANRFKLLHSIVQNFASHGVWISSTGTSNQSCCFKILDSFIGFNQGDGVYSTNTADGFIQAATEIDNNGLTAVVNTNASGVATYVSGTTWSTDSSLAGTTIKVNGVLCQISAVTSTTFSTTNCQSSVNSLSNVTVYWGGGIELSDSLTNRIEGDDIGGNFSFGIIGYGSGTGISATGNFIIGNQFGGNYTHDLEIQGYGLASANQTGSYYNTIVGNQFIGKSSLAQSNTWDDIFVRDSKFNTFTSNFLNSNNGVRNGVNITESAAGRDLAEIVSDNSALPLFGTAAYNCNTQNSCTSVLYRGNMNGTTSNSVTNEWSSLSAYVTSAAPGGTGALASWVNLKPIVVTHLKVVANSPVQAGCTTNPTFLITDGTNTVSCTATNGSTGCDSGAVGTNLGVGTISVEVNPNAAGCTTTITSINVTATIKPAY